MLEKDFYKLFKYTITFTILIFLVNVTFFVDENNSYIESEYIEKQVDIESNINNSNTWSTNTWSINISNKNDNLSIEPLKEPILESAKKEDKLNDIIKEQQIGIESKLIEKKEELIGDKPIINTKYISEEFESKIDKNIKLSFYLILKSDLFNFFYNEINVNLNEEKTDIRWKMSNKSLHMYWVNDLWDIEFSTVFIHELGHFIDLYYLKNFLKVDISDKFYNISWDSTKVIKAWQWISDFVSGYSMTNKYEDFAETFTYYVFHNMDFAEKTKNSKILKSKYDFFAENIFKQSKFKNSNFSNEKEIKPYYWDITKIDINLKKFLIYIKS